MNQVIAPAKSGGFPWWGWFLIALVIAVPMCGVTSALAIYGVKKYLTNSKAAEATMALAAFGSGVVKCAEARAADGSPHGLPASSRQVPESLAQVSGKKYQSRPDEWSDEAFVCSGFSRPMPQYFTYQWQRTSPTHGVAIAHADLDANGVADQTLEQPVDCNEAGKCALGKLEMH